MSVHITSDVGNTPPPQLPPSLSPSLSSSFSACSTPVSRLPLPRHTHRHLSFSVLSISVSVTRPLPVYPPLCPALAGMEPSDRRSRQTDGAGLTVTRASHEWLHRERRPGVVPLLGVMERSARGTPTQASPPEVPPAGPLPAPSSLDGQGGAGPWLRAVFPPQTAP